MANSRSITNSKIDAVPKKRGPKTDVLEALLKRVDGLERRLKDEKKSHSPNGEVVSVTAEESINGDTKPQRPQLNTNTIPDESAVYSPSPPRFVFAIVEEGAILTNHSAPSPAVQPDALLDTYFTRCRGKAYHILDETSTRQRIQLNNIPSYLLYAIYAVSARWVAFSVATKVGLNIRRYTAHPNGYHAAVRLSEEYASRARTEVDIDDPSIDTLQSLLLLGVSYTAAGKGKKAYMMLGA
jgi:hypothetical protein